MYTNARVKEINSDGTVLVSCSSEACQGCKAEMFCNNKNHTDYLAKNDKKIDLEIGDNVELFLPPGKTVLSSALVFALPLILFPIGYLLLKKFTSFNELICALGGFAFMALAFGIASIVSIRCKKALMPTVCRCLRTDGKNNE